MGAIMGAMFRPLALATLLLVAAPLGHARQGPTADGEFAKPMDPSRPPSPYAPGDLGRHAPGFFLRAHGETRFRFVDWESENTLTQALAALPKSETGTAEVRMAPGRYVVEQEIVIESVDRLTITGGPSAQFVFADGPDAVTSLAAPVEPGDLVLRVSEIGRLREGFHYQVYKADGTGDRLLEFTVLAIKDGLVYLTREVQFMSHVRSVPAGASVIEQVNFFRVRECNDLTLEGLHCDGRHRGGVRTHTTYCGVYATGRYIPHQRATTKGLTVRNSSFKNLKGRGVVFYGMEDVAIEGNYFEHIRAQAIEIDHFSSGHVRGNVVNGAEVGVMVNDAYESVVEGNVLRHCQDGIRFREIYDDDWVNTGNIARDNLIGPGLRYGVYFQFEGCVDNLIEGNVFIGYGKENRVFGGEGNDVRLTD